MSYDAVLGSTRSTLLEQIGAKVECAASLQSFARCLLAHEVAIVTICTSVPDADVQVITAASHECRPGRVVVGLQVVDYVKRPHVDVSISGSPQILQDEIRKLLNRSAHSNGS